MSMVSFISVSTETLTGLGSANLLSISVDIPRWQYKWQMIYYHELLSKYVIIWHYSMDELKTKHAVTKLILKHL